mmetsp:Transcript_20362/g.64050  ORF Transcript_20362/g.64050 Transcript_20362/m.64050 type:complete len:265 (+) Transcript_20362:189-983(+)
MSDRDEDEPLDDDAEEDYGDERDEDDDDDDVDEEDEEDDEDEDDDSDQMRLDEPPPPAAPRRGYLPRWARSAFDVVARPKLGPVGRAAARAFSQTYGRLVADACGPDARPPAFYADSYRQAAASAAAQSKLLLIYLHSALHEDAAAFCRDALATPDVERFCRSRFVLWGADVESADGHALADALRAAVDKPAADALADREGFSEDEETQHLADEEGFAPSPEDAEEDAALQDALAAALQEAVEASAKISQRRRRKSGASAAASP